MIVDLNGLLGRAISEQDACWLNKYGIICNTCAEMLLATATAVLYSPRKSSLESSRRRASVRVAVGGMFANRYIFISQLLAQRVGPRVYIRRYVTPRGRNSDFPSKQNDLRLPRLDLSSLLPPLHLIWRPWSPLMDPRISRFSSAEGCADRSVMRARFLGVSHEI